MPDHQKGKEEGREVTSTDRGNVPCQERGEWIEVTIISCGVEISIAGGVEERKDIPTTVTFFFLFFFFSFFLFESRLLIVSIGANAHQCLSYSSRYNGLSIKHGPRSPKPPTTVHPAIPKLKPSDPARQRNPRPVLWVETTRR